VLGSQSFEAQVLTTSERLADLDRSVLEKLVAGSVAEVTRRCGQHGGA
jgi:hypothetical protein